MSMSLCLSPMTWLPDLRPAMAVADCPPGVEARQNETGPWVQGPVEGGAPAEQAYPRRTLRPSIPFPRRAATTNRPIANLADRAAVSRRAFCFVISGPR